MLAWLTFSIVVISTFWCASADAKREDKACKGADTASMLQGHIRVDSLDTNEESTKNITGHLRNVTLGKFDTAESKLEFDLNDGVNLLWMMEQGLSFVRVDASKSLDAFAMRDRRHDNALMTRFTLQMIGAGSILVAVVICCTCAGKAFFSDVDKASIAWKVIKGVFFGSMHIVFSTALILFNKYLLHPQRFPYPVPLTTLHMAGAFVFMRILQSCSPWLFASAAQNEMKANNAAPAASASVLKDLLAFLPIGSCSAFAIVTGNWAYTYASVSFLQMIKEAMVLMTYLLGVLWGLETMRFRNLVVLVFVTTSAAVAVKGEIHFVWLGLLLQTFSSMAQATQAVIANIFMTRTGEPKIDPLTMVLKTAPVVLLVLLPLNCFFWSPSILSQLFIYKFELLLSTFLGISIQIVNTVTVYQIGATGLALAAVVKDMMIVVAAVHILHESLTRMQVLGFSGAICGIALYSSMKVFPSWFERPAGDNSEAATSMKK